MAVSKFMNRDWLLGWLVPSGTGQAAIQAVALVDPTTGLPSTTLATAANQLAGNTLSTSVVSAANSTNVVLAANAVFTGVQVDVTQFGSISVSGVASAASAANGVSIQQSTDGVNWDFVDVYTSAAATAFKFQSPRQGIWARVVYTNGATPLTSFRLLTILNPQMPRAVAVRPADAMTVENDMDQAVSVQTTYNGTTLDLQRSVVNATNSTGTGIPAMGLVAQVDDTSPTAVTENQFGNVRMSTDHSLLTTVQNSYSHISTAATTVVKSGAGTLCRVTVNSLGTVASSTTIYDNTAGSGTVIAVINTLALSGPFDYDIQFSTGLTLVTTGTAAPDITVSYK